MAIIKLSSSSIKGALGALLFASSLGIAGATTALALPTPCADGFDNDLDGLIDAIDPGCLSVNDPDEEDQGLTCRINIWQVGKADQGLLNGQVSGPVPVEDGQWAVGTGFTEVSTTDPFIGAPSVGVLGYAPFSVMKPENTPELEVSKTVQFTFELTHEVSHPEFLIGRYGSETNEVRLDGELIGSTAGEDGIMKRDLFEPASLQPGVHTLALTYLEDGENGGNYLDFIAFNGCMARPACSDGWDNDGDGLSDMLDYGCLSPDQDSESGEAPGASKIFQIGKFDAFKSHNSNSILEFLHEDSFYDVMNYQVTGTGTDSPPLGGFMSDGLLLSEATYPDGTLLAADGRPLIAATRRINLNFSLPSSVEKAQIRLTRMGNETNTILLDDNIVAQTVADTGVMMAFYIPVGNLAAGNHTLSIRYDNGGLNNGNYWDAIALIGYAQPIATPTPTPTPEATITPVATPTPESTVAPEATPCPIEKPSDLCGVCGGDNSTCRSCDSINTEPIQKTVLDQGLLQLNLARRAHQRVLELTRNSKKAAAPSMRKKSKKELKRLNPRYTAESQVELRLTYPLVVTTSCSITEGCADAELTSSVADFKARVTDYYSSGVAAVNGLKKLGVSLKNPKSHDARRLGRLKTTHKEFLDNLSMLPGQTLLCK